VYHRTDFESDPEKRTKFMAQHEEKTQACAKAQGVPFETSCNKLSDSRNRLETVLIDNHPHKRAFSV